MGLKAGFIRRCSLALVFTLAPAVQVQVCQGEFAKRVIQRNDNRTFRVLDPSSPGDEVPWLEATPHQWGCKAGFIQRCSLALVFTLAPAVKVQVCPGGFEKRDIQRNAKRKLRVLDPSWPGDEVPWL